MEALSFVSKKDRLEKPHHRAIRPRCGCRDGKIIQYPQTATKKPPEPSLVRHFTAGRSRLYQPLGTVSARLALPARALEETAKKQH
jgi:hypothetical protein